MVILYEVYGGLYVNLTNKCPCACTFCLRQSRDEMNGSGSLWLEREPSLDEIKKEFEKADMSKYKEVVFCGFGEPTERLYDMLAAAEFVKERYGLPTRVNTNGLGDLINGIDTASLYAGKIDTVSISLNTSDPERYLETVRPKFGRGSFEAMLKFAENVKKYVGKVVMTTVSDTITHEDEERCGEICAGLGVTYRIRTFEK